MNDYPNDIVLAQIALSTYRETSSLSRNNTAIEARRVETIAKGDLLADIYRYADKLIVIAIRGTDNLGNWGTNLKTLMVNGADVLNRPGSVESSYIAGRVHEGFGQASALLTRPLRHWLHDHAPDGSSVILVGHSLGGAIACYLAAWVANQANASVTVDSVHTYGMPRIGDKLYVDCWNELLGHCHHRNVNCIDGVPKLPLAWDGYRHLAGLQYWDRNGRKSNVNLFQRAWDQVLAAKDDWGKRGLSIIEYHDMERYLELAVADGFEALP